MISIFLPLHCLAAVVIISDKAPSLRWVIDATIAYPQGKPLHFIHVLLGNQEPCQTLIHYRKYLVRDIPREEQALMQWLIDRYVEKEQLLDEFYKTGKFPDEGQFSRNRPRILKVDTVRAWTYQVIVYLSFAFHYYLIVQLINYLFSSIRGLL